MRLSRLAVPVALSLLVPAAEAVVQAPVLKWQDGGCTSWCQTGWYASPAVADLDGNGTREVIWSAYDTFVLAGVSGAPIYSWENGGDRSGGGGVGRAWPGVVVADIDGDGQLDIATAHSDGWVSVLDANGYFKPGWPRQPTPGDELRTLAVYDLEGDGNLEVLVASTRDEDQWFVYEHDGSVRPGWPQLGPGGQYATGCFNQNVAVGDVDGNGVAEIIGPNDTHYVNAFYADGQAIPSHSMFGAGKFWRNTGVWIDLAAELRGYGNCGPEDRPNWNSGGCIVVDVDGNGVNEVVGVGNVHDCSFSPYLDIYEQAYVWKGDRSRWSNATYDWSNLPLPTGNAAPLSTDYNILENSMPNAVAADLDGDGEMEILYASYDGRVHCYGLGKTERGNWPVEVYNPAEGFFRFASEPVVADLDNDGSAEVLFGSWPQKSSLTVGYLHIADANGNELHRVPVPAVAGDWNGILAAPTLDNIDADADLEAVVGTSATGVVAYDLPGTASARVIWGTGRGSYQRFGGYLAFPITAEFTAAPRQGAPPLAVQFTDLSTGNPSSFAWTFGDGGTSTSQSPSHTYTAAGLYTVSLTVARGPSSDTETKTSYVHVTTGTPHKVLAGAGPGPGNGNVVKVFEPDGTLVSQFTGFSAGSFGTNVRAGTISGGPTPALLIGPGPGPVFGPQVRAFATNGSPLSKVNFFAYATLRFGVAAEGGDVEADGFDEIVTGAGPGAVFGPHVRGFDYDGAAVAAIAKINFFAYSTLKWGVNAASASIDGDAPGEIVTGAGPGNVFAPTVRGFNYDGGPLSAISKVNFNAFGTGTFGANVALGSVDGDAPAEILAGRGPGAANAAQLRGFNFDGTGLAPLAGLDGTPWSSLYGVQLAAGDVTGAAPRDVQAGAGADPTSPARHAAYAYAGGALTPLGFAGFDAFPGLAYGLKVGDAAF